MTAVCVAVAFVALNAIFALGVVIGVWFGRLGAADKRDADLAGSLEYNLRPG